MMPVLFALAVPAAERTYHERFTEALTNGQRGFMKGSELVDTNNSAPTLTNAPMPFKKFTDGELARIKLGKHQRRLARVVELGSFSVMP